MAYHGYILLYDLITQALPYNFPDIGLGMEEKKKIT